MKTEKGYLFGKLIMALVELRKEIVQTKEV